jgi:hypothetical protein
MTGDWQEDEQKITAQLKVIRKRRKRVWVTWLLFIPFIVVIGLVDKFNFKGVLNTFALDLIYLAGWIFIGLRLYFSKCPRCGRIFFADQNWTSKLFSTKCLNCGLSFRDINDRDAILL